MVQCHGSSDGRFHGQGSKDIELGVDRAWTQGEAWSLSEPPSTGQRLNRFCGALALERVPFLSAFALDMAKPFAKGRSRHDRRLAQRCKIRSLYELSQAVIIR
jgi:hypothetical protein